MITIAYIFYLSQCLRLFGGLYQWLMTSNSRSHILLSWYVAVDYDGFYIEILGSQKSSKWLALIL